MAGGFNNEAWRLRYLTDTKKLPDFDEQGGYGSPYVGFRGRGSPYRGPGANHTGAPVDADGKPIYYSVPKSYVPTPRTTASAASGLEPARGRGASATHRLGEVEMILRRFPLEPGVRRSRRP